MQVVATLMLRIQTIDAFLKLLFFEIYAQKMCLKNFQ